MAGYAIYADNIYDAIRGGVVAPEGFAKEHIWVSASGTNNMEATEANPTNNLAIAMAMAKDNSVIHIVGRYDYTKAGNINWGMPTPVNVSKITFKGEGDDAAIYLNGKHLHIKSDAEFDNIGFYTTESGALHIACGYNNVTFTETFKCSKALFAAGMITFSEDKTNGYYNSRESVSSSKDCVITVNGGQYDYFLGGNYLFGNFATAIYGTYSGNMTVNIGAGAVINNQIRNGACGQNYLAGNITFNVASWPAGYVVRHFGWLGNANESASYNILNNTGTITVNILGDLTNGVAKAEDLNADGNVDVKDALEGIKYVVNGMPASIKNSYSPYYYGITNFDLLQAIRLLKKLVF